MITGNMHDSGKCCVGPDCCCKFDATQSQMLIKSDPKFLKTSNQLQAELGTMHSTILSMLNDRSVSNETIMKSVQKYLEKNKALELRAIEYFISIKPHLIIEQKKQIFCSCTQSICGNNPESKHAQ
jgi:hypothetical protein